MAEFTKDIQTLTQQAGASPQLQTNTGSLATDLVSAAGFGLGLYRQNKAATALEAAKTQQADYQTKVAEGILAFSDFKINMSNQKINSTAYNRKEKEFFKEMGAGAEFRQSVISGANKLTGETSLDTGRALDKAALQRQENAELLTTNAYDGAIEAGLSVAGIDEMSPEEQQYLVRQGQIATKSKEVKAAKLSNQIQSGAYDKMTSAKKTATYLSSAMPEFSDSFSSKFNTKVDELGGYNFKNIEAFQAIIDEDRTALDSKIKQHVELARGSGIELSPEQQNAFRQSANTMYNDFESLIGQEAVNKALAGVPDKIVMQNIIKGLTSPKESTRSSALTVLMKMGGQVLTGVDIAEAFEMIAGISEGNKKLSDDKDDAREEVKEATNAFTAPSNDDGTFTAKQKTFNKDIAVNLMQSTPKQVKKAVEAGGFDKLVSSVNDYQGKNFEVVDHPEMATLVYDLGSRVVSSAIAAAYNAPKSKMLGGTRMDRQAVSTGTADNFYVDEKTAELIPNEGFVWIGDEVKNYNNYIRKTTKSLEYLGGDVEAFKKDAISSILSVR